MEALLEAMMYKRQLLYDTYYIYIYIYKVEKRDTTFHTANSFKIDVYWAQH